MTLAERAQEIEERLLFNIEQFLISQQALNASKLKHESEKREEENRRTPVTVYEYMNRQNGRNGFWQHEAQELFDETKRRLISLIPAEGVFFKVKNKYLISVCMGEISISPLTNNPDTSSATSDQPQEDRE